MAARRYPLLMLALLGASWPVWLWYLPASLDASNEYAGLLAAATLPLLLRRAPAGRGALRHPLALPGAFIALYAAATLAGLSVALRALPAILALAALASAWRLDKRLDLPLAAMAVLALPFAASLQFYVGYPLRVVAGGVAAALLQLNGIAVVREGAMLAWDGRLVSIDAPCSGVKMLWAGLYLVFALAALYRYSARQTALALALAVSTVVLANAVRAAALFYVETGLIRLPTWSHEATGLITFALAALALVAGMQGIGRMRT